MNTAKTALHILQQIRHDPRLAYLIGPGSESFELLIRDAAQLQALDVDVARRMYSKGLRFKDWPSEQTIQCRIDDAVAQATPPTSARAHGHSGPDFADLYEVPTC